MNDYKKNRGTNTAKGKGNSSKRGARSNTRKPGKMDLGDPNLTEISNDVSWWAANPQLVKDVASLPFAHRAGTALPLFDSNDGQYRPGSVMCILMTPSLGCCKNLADAPNVAAKYIYSFIRHANSGSANYESPDLMMMMVSWASIAAQLERAKRVYGNAMTYSAYNAALPHNLLRADGFYPEAVIENLAEFRYYINYLSRKLSSIRIPKDWPIYLRWKGLSETYYVDEDSHKAQIYLPCLTQYYRWEPKLAPTGSALVEEVWWKGRASSTTTGVSLREWFEWLDKGIEALVNDEDVGIMSGDIIKAYGMENTQDISIIAADYITVPSKSAEMLTAIHNLGLSREISSSGSSNLAGRVNTCTIFQNAAGAIVENRFISDEPDNVIAAAPDYYGKATNLYFTRDITGNDSERILDLYTDDTSPENVITATRLMGPITQRESDNLYLKRNDDGEYELASSPNWIMMRHGGTELIDSIGMFTDSGKEYISWSTIADETQLKLKDLGVFLTFNWSPITYVADPAIEMNHFGFSTIIGQIDNFTTISQTTLANMNDMCMLSAFTQTPKTSI